MKELTIEQKAQRYDEAIEIARKEYEKHKSFKGFCEMLVHIFPELKENEKIRKAILSGLKHLETELGWDAVGDIDILDAYAWLERQGEQKSIDNLTQQEAMDIAVAKCLDEQKPIDKVVKFNVGDKVYNIKDKIECTIESIDDTTYYCDATNFDIKDQNDWELVEQKLAWSDEDEKKRNLLIAILNVNHPNGYFKANPIGTTNMEAMSKDELVSWLKSIKDRVQPKKKWSEEDESMRTRCIGILGKCYMGELPTKVEEELNWLKSLRPQNTWKPSEGQIH